MGMARMGSIRHSILRYPALFAAAAASCVPALAEDGEMLFVELCGPCHTLSRNEPQRQGPILAGIVGRAAGTVEGFPYSNGLAEADWSWSEETLLAWLEDPQAMIADSYMLFNEPDPAVRHGVIQFLKTTASE
jgi:cytochrome c